MKHPETGINSWWGAHTLDINQAGVWQIGPSTVWLHRSNEEWRVIYEPGLDPMDNSHRIEIPATDMDRPWEMDSGTDDRHLSRFSFKRTGPEVRILPALADRAIVVRPETPISIPEGETATLFISTPLWFRIDVGRPNRTLLELPLIRPSDTWFGPNTREGELCYNTRTKARLRLTDVAQRHHRALTAIKIQNQAEDALLLERFRLPVEHLSLYRSEQHFLWTESVTLERMKGDDSATLRIGEGAAKDAGATEFVVGPREASKSNVLVRPFSMLFQKIREG